jgi:hypothetical protein
MIKMIETEKGVVFSFRISLDHATAPLTGTDVKLFVVGNPRSPFQLVNTATPGEAQYVTVEGDFPAADYKAWLVWTRDVNTVLFSDAFEIVSLPEPEEP